MKKVRRTQASTPHISGESGGAAGVWLLVISPLRTVVAAAVTLAVGVVTVAVGAMATVVWLVAGAVVAAMAVRPTGLVTVGVVTRGVLGVMVPGVVVPGVETVRGTWTAAVLFVRFALVVTALWAASGVGWVATPAVGLGAVGVCDVADRDGWAALVFTVAGVVPLVAVATGLVAVVRLGVRLGVPALEALESVEVAAGAADAVAGFSVITHPIPRATASAPTRPMLFAAPIAASFAKRGDCRAVRHG